MSTPHKRVGALIPAGSASSHDEAPKPLLGDNPAKRSTIGLSMMTYQQLEAFGEELDAVRQQILDDLGQDDADYIRRVIKVQRGFEVAGRALMCAPFILPAWIAGVAALTISKILDNMEIGHNVMHGQYDWMNDPQISGQTYEWDLVAPAAEWKHTHNFIHHTYTNIHGLDKDIGYELVRIDEDQPYEWKYLANPLYALGLMFVFEFGILSHGIRWKDRANGTLSKAEFNQQVRRAWHKSGRQLLKDYVAFPALALPLVPVFGPAPVLAVLGGNLIANVVRNVWTFNIIWCGHFPAEVETFQQSDAENESRGQWYLRQLLGSANISGNKLFHLMSGNLSHQIEHHLFPDIPARRYPEAAGTVRALCEKYGLKYNTGRMSKQLFSVARQLVKFAKPPKDKSMWADKYQRRWARKSAARVAPRYRVEANTTVTV